MKDEICRSCIDCAVTRCDNHTSNRPYPAFCVSKQVSDAQREASLQQYLHRRGGPEAGPGGRGHRVRRLPEMAQGPGDHPLRQADGVP